jgi:hypothetical protein
MDIFRFVPGYRSAIYLEGKEPLFLLFVAFLIAFTLTRGYTRLARTRGWGSGSIGGVHLHHSLVGIVIVLAAGFVAFLPVGEEDVARDLCSICFGVGAALVLDEFALVFYLRDVYWSREGRDSVNATILGLMVAGLCLFVSEPFGLGGPTTSPSRLAFFATVASNVVFAAITFLKGKPFAGSAAILLPVVGMVGSIRLAKPTSPWARWFYRPDRGPERRRAARARKLSRAERRAQSGRAARFERWLDDVVGGKPASS